MFQRIPTDRESNVSGLVHGLQFACVYMDVLADIMSILTFSALNVSHNTSPRFRRGRDEQERTIASETPHYDSSLVIVFEETRTWMSVNAQAAFQWALPVARGPMLCNVWIRCLPLSNHCCCSSVSRTSYKVEGRIRVLVRLARGS